MLLWPRSFRVVLARVTARFCPCLRVSLVAVLPFGFSLGLRTDCNVRVERGFQPSEVGEGYHVFGGNCPKDLPTLTYKLLFRRIPARPCRSYISREALTIVLDSLAMQFSRSLTKISRLQSPSQNSNFLGRASIKTARLWAGQVLFLHEREKNTCHLRCRRALRVVLNLLFYCDRL